MQNNMEIINELSCLDQNDNGKISQIVEIIKKAAEATHTVLLVKQKSKRAIDAIETNDKAFMWNVLQEYLRQYSSFINGMTCVTNIEVRRVSKKFYDSITVNGIAEQLQMVIKFIYVKELTISNAKAALRNRVKSDLLNSGIITQKDLRYML